MRELIDRLNRLKVTMQYYDDLIRTSVHDKIELENIQLKMQFAKKEMLLLLMEIDKELNKDVNSS